MLHESFYDSQTSRPFSPLGNKKYFFQEALNTANHLSLRN